MKKRVRGYVFSRSFMGERVPQHVQNLVIRDYCERNNLQFLLSASEYAMEDCHLILKLLVDELPQIDGIAAYSVFQLPENDAERHWVYDQVLKMGKQLHFCVEGLSMRNENDRTRIENIWRVSKTLSSINKNN
jgi:sporadic carbohydrate cluster protein (TIGR04323 family)